MASIPSWLWAVVVGGSGVGGGFLGYWLRAEVADALAERRELRHFRQADLKSMRDELHYFLGEPRAHFTWLQRVQDARTAGGSPSPDAKARMIAEWVYRNAPRFPETRRGAMYLIMGVAYQLAQGDRSFLDGNFGGPEALKAAWESLEEYVQILTLDLHGGRRMHPAAAM